MILVAGYVLTRPGSPPAAPAARDAPVGHPDDVTAGPPPPPRLPAPLPNRPHLGAPPLDGLPAGATLISVTNASAATTNPDAVPPVEPLAAPTDEPPPMPPAMARFLADRDRYMTTVIATRVESCWRAVPGSGEIEFVYTLRAAALTGETKLEPSIESELGHDSPVSIVESSLSPDQNRAALDCMLDAVDDTAFVTVLPSPELGTLVALHQRWRVGPRPPGGDAVGRDDAHVGSRAGRPQP